jgi:membrane protein required for beta-lactamase induction
MFYWRWKKYLAEPDCRPHWHRAWLVSGLFLVTVLFCQRFVEGQLFGFYLVPVKVLSIVIAVAIGLDLYHELVARRAAAREGHRLVPFEVHQDMADALEAADRLSAAQPMVVEESTYRRVDYEKASSVPILVQGLHFRSLFYFFAPFTPLIIMGAPASKGVEAHVKARS